MRSCARCGTRGRDWGGGGGEGTGTNVAASAVPQSEGTALVEGCSEHFILAGWSPCFLFSFFRGGRGERW